MSTVPSRDKLRASSSKACISDFRQQHVYTNETSENLTSAYQNANIVPRGARRPDINQDQDLLESTRVITSLLRATHLKDGWPDTEDASALATLLDGTHLEENMTTLATVLNTVHLGIGYDRHSRYAFDSNSAPGPLHSKHITPMCLQNPSAMQLSCGQQVTPVGMRLNALVCPLDDAELYRCRYHREHGRRWMLRTMDQRSEPVEDHILTHHDSESW